MEDKVNQVKTKVENYFWGVRPKIKIYKRKRGKSYDEKKSSEIDSIVNGVNVFAGSSSGTIGTSRIYLSVTTRKAYASTGGNYAKTQVYPYKYKTGGSASQLIAMNSVSGGAEVTVYAPNGWDIGKAQSVHTYGGISKTLQAYK